MFRLMLHTGFIYSTRLGTKNEFYIYFVLLLEIVRTAINIF